MKIQVTYSNGITQVLEVIEQSLYDAIGMIEKSGAKVTNPELLRIKELKKAGTMCTTGSPIYLAHLAGDGLMDLGTNQGGVHKIETKIIEE
jgi:hypothetical protein